MSSSEIPTKDRAWTGSREEREEAYVLSGISREAQPPDQLPANNNERGCSMQPDELLDLAKSNRIIHRRENMSCRGNSPKAIAEPVEYNLDDDDPYNEYAYSYSEYAQSGEIPTGTRNASLEQSQPTPSVQPADHKSGKPPNLLALGEPRCTSTDVRRESECGRAPEYKIMKGDMGHAVGDPSSCRLCKEGTTDSLGSQWTRSGEQIIASGLAKDAQESAELMHSDARDDDECKCPAISDVSAGVAESGAISPRQRENTYRSNSLEDDVERPVEYNFDDDDPYNEYVYSGVVQFGRMPAGARTSSLDRSKQTSPRQPHAGTGRSPNPLPKSLNMTPAVRRESKSGREPEYMIMKGDTGCAVGDPPSSSLRKEGTKDILGSQCTRSGEQIIASGLATDAEESAELTPQHSEIESMTVNTDWRGGDAAVAFNRDCGLHAYHAVPASIHSKSPPCAQLVVSSSSRPASERKCHLEDVQLASENMKETSVVEQLARDDDECKCPAISDVSAAVAESGAISPRQRETSCRSNSLEDNVTRPVEYNFDDDDPYNEYVYSGVVQFGRMPAGARTSSLDRSKRTSPRPHARTGRSPNPLPKSPGMTSTVRRESKSGREPEYMIMKGDTGCAVGDPPSSSLRKEGTKDILGSQRTSSGDQIIASGSATDAEESAELMPQHSEIESVTVNTDWGGGDAADADVAFNRDCGLHAYHAVPAATHSKSPPCAQLVVSSASRPASERKCHLEDVQLASGKTKETSFVEQLARNDDECKCPAISDVSAAVAESGAITPRQRETSCRSNSLEDNVTRPVEYNFDDDDPYNEYVYSGAVQFGRMPTGARTSSLDRSEQTSPRQPHAWAGRYPNPLPKSPNMTPDDRRESGSDEPEYMTMKSVNDYMYVRVGTPERFPFLHSLSVPHASCRHEPMHQGDEAEIQEKVKLTSAAEYAMIPCRSENTACAAAASDDDNDDDGCGARLGETTERHGFFAHTRVTLPRSSSPPRLPPRSELRNTVGHQHQPRLTAAAGQADQAYASRKRSNAMSHTAHDHRSQPRHMLGAYRGNSIPRNWKIKEPIVNAPALDGECPKSNPPSLLLLPASWKLEDSRQPGSMSARRHLPGGCYWTPVLKRKPRV
ncbi:uncharacterized protein LOC135830372 [Sycon ciliatum]|uniref:uncharacterized protein LOC135830372 n=1 Tax=Sycon ciliatum TaxID=27933 RepID=UPI0031F70551